MTKPQMSQFAGSVGLAILLIVVGLLTSFVSLPGTLWAILRYVATGEASGEGLMAWPYVWFGGRDDLRGEAIGGLLFLVVGLTEWGWLLVAVIRFLR